MERYTTEIRGDRMQMLGGRGGAGGMASRQGASFPTVSRSAREPAPSGAGAKPAVAKKPGSFDDLDDEIPF